MDDLPSRGSPFAETEALLAVLDEGSTDGEITRRVAAMLPGERRAMLDACHRLTEAIYDANRERRR